MTTCTNDSNIIAIKEQTYPVGIEWGLYKNKLKIPQIRLPDLSIHTDFRAFTISVARTTNEEPKAFKKGMESLGYALCEYARFLSSIGITWLDVDDKILARYRDYSLENVKRKKTMRSETAARRTTNIKIRLLYELYAWAVFGAQSQTPTIGTGADDAIQSTLPLKQANPTKYNCQKKRLYPQCFQGVGEGSASMSGQHWATNSELSDVEDFFKSTHESSTAMRNILYLRVTDLTGMRRESVNSLMTSQFSDESIERSIKGELPAHSIQPQKQKLNRQYYFDVPYPLALQINRFIKSIYGNDVFTVQKKSPKDLGRPLFISMTSGEAVEDATWTDIFSDAFHAIGAPIGACIHSIRRKFAEEWFRKEVQRCLDKGEPVSYRDIVAGLARVLGQDSKLSQEAYLRASRSARVLTPLDALTEQNRELTSQVIHLTAQVNEKDNEILLLRKTLDSTSRVAKRPQRPRGKAITKSLHA